MRKRTWAVLSLVGLGGAATSYAQSTWKLNINGAAVSTSARKIGGKTYVPIEDVARALKMKASVSGNLITLKPAGGTYQVANKLVGSQGEELFSGRWGFKVTGVQRGASFKSQYRNNFNREEQYKAENGEELIIVSAQIKNGTKAKEEFAFSNYSNYGMNTALTDQNAASYQPAGFDVFAEEPAPLGKSALPGASVPFNLVFRVPQNTQIKDLVFSVVLYRERGDGKSTDFRVALNQPTAAP